jgi:hypothetical protein
MAEFPTVRLRAEDLPNIARRLQALSTCNDMLQQAQTREEAAAMFDALCINAEILAAGYPEEFNFWTRDNIRAAVRSGIGDMGKIKDVCLKFRLV